MCQQILSQSYELHQGTVRTRAHLSIDCPGMDNDIDNLILACQKYQDCLPLQMNVKEPIIQKPRPGRPFQLIAIDFCLHTGEDYLIIVDCLTDWSAIISTVHGTTTSQVVTALHQLFCIPDIVWSDRRIQFTSKTFHGQKFAKQWGFSHRISTPHYP